MIDVSLASYVAIAVISIYFLQSLFHVRYIQTIFGHFPLGRIESITTKLKDVALLYFSMATNYDTIGSMSFLFLIPTIIKFSCNCFGISQFNGRFTQVQNNKQHQRDQLQEQRVENGDHHLEEIDLDYEKNQPYMKAALSKYPNLADDDLINALKDLHRQGIADRRNPVDLFTAIEHQLHNRHAVREEPTDYEEPEPSREELVEVLVASNRYERRDIEDVVRRYQEKNFGRIPTMEQFVEFHSGLRGIADLEAKLDEKDRKIIRTVQDKNRTVQEKDRTIEDKDRTIEDNHRALEDKDRALEDKDRTIRELESQVNRSLCKICMVGEVSIVCIPCGHLYCCAGTRCRGQLNTQRKCHMCNQPIFNQIEITLS